MECGQYEEIEGVVCNWPEHIECVACVAADHRNDAMSKKARPADAVFARGEVERRVRRMHRRDLNRVWQFLKLVFRDVNRETVEYQRPRHKKHFLEIYEEEGIEQLLFETRSNAKRLHARRLWLRHELVER